MANKKISDLTAASTAASANEFEINESGTSKKVTGAQISAFVKADLLDDTTVNFTGTLQNGGSNVVVDSDIGSTVQGYDADLTAIGALAKTDGNFIVGNGTTWVAESAATVRTSLGLGALATLSAVSNGEINSGAVDTDELADNAVTNAKMADDSVGIAELSATGTPSSSTFLRGDNTWASGTSNLTTTTGSAPYYGARAFASFNNSGTIAASGNVSSVTRTATGNYTITFSTSMPDTNYTCVGNYLNNDSATGSNNDGQMVIYSRTTTQVKVLCVNGGAAAVDAARAFIVIFR